MSAARSAARPTSTRAPRGDERGHVLLFVLGIMALCAVLVVALSNLLRLENRASTNLITAREARLAAEAGVERALHLLGKQELREPISSLHQPSVYLSQDGSTWGADQPLWDARNPSFKQDVTTHGFAHSGRLSQGSGGETVFKLRVVDCSSRINLNGAQGTLGATIDALGRAVREFAWRRRVRSDPLYDAGYAARASAEGIRPRDPVRGRGGAIVRLRRSQPQGRFKSWGALETLLGEDDLALLRPFVTISSPLDPVRDVHPVNVNTATWPVLVAVLEGLSRDRPPSADEVTPALARLLADAFDARRRDPAQGPFRQVAALREFWLATLESVGRTEAEESLSSLVPNYAPTGWPGNGPADYPISHDCEVTTVPFRLASMGVFDVTSLGVVFDKDGKDLAQVELRAVVQVYDTIRLTTQEDLEVVRSSDDDWGIESFPNPVGPLAGPRRFRMDGRAGQTFSHRNGNNRRVLRWEVGSRGVGYLMPASLEPGLPSLGAGVDPQIERVHVFRFNADLTGSVFRPAGGLVVGKEHQPLGSTYQRLYAYGYGIGTHPYDLGDTVSRPNLDPLTGVNNTVRNYAPDGYVTRRNRSVDLYYLNNDPKAEGPILTGSGMISLQYKTQEYVAEWTPLFEARVRPGKEYVGLTRSDFVDVQVLVRSGPVAAADDDEGSGGSGATAFKIELLTRFVSTRAPAVAPDPQLPPALALNRRIIEQVFRFPGLSAGKWVTIQIPFHLNAHVPTVNGRLGTALPPAGAAAPTWPPYSADTISPGGYGGGTRGAMADTSIDNLIIVNLNNDAGAALLKAVLAGTTSLVPEDRFELAGPDRVGSWVADLPPIRGGRSVRFGELMWEAWFPKRWQTIEWEPCDWLIQGTFAVGPSQPRRRVSRRLMPPPRDAGRLSDEYTRYWWLRYLRQRESRLGVRVAHAARLLRLASLPHAPDPATQKTAAALRDAFTAQRDAVTQQIQRVVGAHGEASRPPRPESRSRPSAAFGLRWRPNRKEDRVRVRLDFVLLPRSARPTAGTPMTSAVSEVVLPYQTAPRILSLEVVD